MEQKPDKSSSGNIKVKTFVIASIALALTACSHCPPIEPFEGEGNRFVNLWQVEEVRAIDARAQPPVNVGGVFALTRTSKRLKQFRVIPGTKFSEINDEWKRLELVYNAGSESKKPPKLISGRGVSKTSQSIQQNEASTGTKGHAEKAAYGTKVIPIEPDVLEKYFRNLKNEGLETLNGSMEINGKPNFITVFSVGIKETPTEGLLIFYCETEQCDHSGLIHARPK